MASIDDIKGETPASEAAGPPAKSGPRSVGPESESRGGAEAPDATLADRDGDAEAS
jgi:hypothetical protein